LAEDPKATPVDVGHIPFDPEAANLTFSLVSARHEPGR
jgi:hypothetical protein